MTRIDILRRLAAHEIGVDEAEGLLANDGPPPIPRPVPPPNKRRSGCGCGCLTVLVVVVSLLVCTVGITNSMLMAVTERYREIGTMKCLGALDKFVVELFLLESLIMGVTASIAGWLIGFLSTFVAAWATHGWRIAISIDLIAVPKMLGVAVGVGTLLTIVATIPPAIRAARMPPAIALRSDI